MEEVGTSLPLVCLQATVKVAQLDVRLSLTLVFAAGGLEIKSLRSTGSLRRAVATKKNLIF